MDEPITRVEMLTEQLADTRRHIRLLRRMLGLRYTGPIEEGIQLQLASLGHREQDLIRKIKATPEGITLMSTLFITRILIGQNAEACAADMMEQKLVVAAKSLAPAHVETVRVLMAYIPSTPLILYETKWNVVLRDDDYLTYGEPNFSL